MGLSKEEKETLERLNAKSKEPDPPTVGKSISANVDLSNPESVSLAQRFGFLPADEPAKPEGDDGDDGDDDKPKRRGYFKDD